MKLRTGIRAGTGFSGWESGSR